MSTIKSVPYDFLSNYYNKALKFEGQTYPTAENAFQASRFVSRDMRYKFAYMPCYHARYCGSAYRTTVPGWWDKRYEILYEVLRIKFSDPELAKQLKATGDAEIVITNNWHDNDYGDCTCRKCRNRVGNNAMGKMLMKLRDEI